MEGGFIVIGLVALMSMAALGLSIAALVVACSKKKQ